MKPSSHQCLSTFFIIIFTSILKLSSTFCPLRAFSEPSATTKKKVIKLKLHEHAIIFHHLKQTLMPSGTQKHLIFSLHLASFIFEIKNALFSFLEQWNVLACLPDKPTPSNQWVHNMPSVEIRNFLFSFVDVSWRWNILCSFVQRHHKRIL